MRAKKYIIINTEVPERLSIISNQHLGVIYYNNYSAAFDYAKKHLSFYQIVEVYN